MAAKAVWPNNLPEQLTSFVGRRREREQVRDALVSTRLLVLTGAGGAGKTRLARQVAAESAELFPDGGWWVELAPVAEAGLVGAELTALSVCARCPVTPRRRRRPPGSQTTAHWLS